MMSQSQRRFRLSLVAVILIGLFGVTLILHTASEQTIVPDVDLNRPPHQDTSLPTSSPLSLEPSSSVEGQEAVEEIEEDVSDDYDIPALPVGHFSLDDDDTKNDVDEAVRRKLHYSTYLYSGYQEFVKSFGLRRGAKAASLEEKCSRFFNQISERDPDWKLNRYTDFNDNIHEIDRTLRDVKETLKKDWRDAHGGSEADYSYNGEEQLKARKMFEDIVKRSLPILHEMGESTTNMRILGKCFFNNGENRDMDLYNKYTKKLFPYLSGKLPKFYQGVSGTATENALPVYDDNYKYTDTLVSFDDGRHNFIEFMRTSINGRGIVISAKDQFKNDLIGLIRVLRASGNQLPIQIIHTGEISLESRTEIVKHATIPAELLFKLKLDKDNEGEKLFEYAKSMHMEFPEQDVWFVDILGCIADEFLKDFTGFFLKILAYFFNSFAEILYLDADAVPLVGTDLLFASKEYRKSGTYFFKDRAMKRILRYIDAATFLGLAPMNERSIDAIFGVPLLTEKTTGNLYFQGWHHYQEAGVVLIDRKRHFLGALMTMPLTVWRNVIRNMIYGDKELYWLGLSLAGDEDYEFNPNSGAAAGMVNTDPAHNLNPEFLTPTICSTHPAHVNEEGQLLWVNSGLRFCKKNGWESDKDDKRLRTFSDEELQKLYEEPSLFQGAVVPPNPPPIWPPGLPYESKEWSQLQAYVPTLQNDRDKDHLLEPGKQLVGLQYGWTSTSVCHHYEYCSYYQVVSFDKTKLYDYGKFYVFSAQETELYSFYGKIWSYAHE